MIIKFLQVKCGDAIIISEENKEHPVNIVIDGGYIGSYLRNLKPALKELPGNYINLWILTHLDADHINGMVSFLRDKESLDQINIKNVWFNCFNSFALDDGKQEVSIGKGIEIRDRLIERDTFLECNIVDGIDWSEGGIKIEVISPDVETFEELKIHWENELEKFKKPEPEIHISKKDADDYSCTIEDLAKEKFKKEISNSLINKSSIAFIFECNNKKILFLGDAHPSKIVSALKARMKKDQDCIYFSHVKLAHHGSKYNISEELLDILDCNSFIISGDGLPGNFLPDKETLAQIICRKKRNMKIPIEFIFNYGNDEIRSIFKVDGEKFADYNCILKFPEGTDKFVKI